ncbi:MAG: Eco57I restriction-modification methylase [Candidatus Hydrogenedentes bacterium ADurb.Bin179]|nr:MAG: Eco57I restriction-modification methylase [Candidatus Hydrogenedentes bacterium ADurb.Bin179]
MNMNNYNPDVLSCLANLSSDEVFTPPQLVNRILDELPPDIWRDPKARFLDPGCKSGVFLREIAKRLDKGLERKITDRQKRLNHIFKNQLYGLAITELTGLLARRSVYCSKTANGKYSVCESFEDPQGNLRFKRIEHSWDNGKCTCCGATQEVYGRGKEMETHAYEFIHTDKPEEIFTMRFDVIVGNPPYQLTVGVQKENYAIALYHLFVQQAKKLNPRYMSMIIPARWYAGGRGLDSFRADMLADTRIRKIVDYPNATDCFPGVDISGGVCYFLWDRDNRGECEVITNQGAGKFTSMTRPLLEKGCDTFIRFNEAISILRKVNGESGERFDTLVSPQTPFGIVSSFKEYKRTPFKGSVKIHTVDGVGYVDKLNILRNEQWIKPWKVFISKSYGERGPYPYLFLAKPFIGVPNSCCTQTYLVIGPFRNESIAKNVVSYIQTRFFRFLIMLKKNTQDAMRGTYAFVPIQNFNEPWNDEKLYKKYRLTKAEVAFIESMVRPVEPNND